MGTQSEHLGSERGDDRRRQDRAPAGSPRHGPSLARVVARNSSARVNCGEQQGVAVSAAVRRRSRRAGDLGVAVMT